MILYIAFNSETLQQAIDHDSTIRNKMIAPILRKRGSLNLNVKQLDLATYALNFLKNESGFDSRFKDFLFLAK